ncbi:MAG: cupin domain-containing protein [Desulfovibrionaceae bacterium]|nr:cupin domain-containing protein [Desulfovibrionaceae bacterium]
MQRTLTAAAIALSLTAAGAAAAGAASAETAPAQTVVRAGSVPSAAGKHTTFTGSVRHDSVFKADADNPFSVSYVTFEPGARTFWHTHPAGQRLIVMSGAGLTGTEDGAVIEILPGDAVYCPPNVKHWHGAMPGTAMTHMALTSMKDGKNVTWLEEVTDEQYAAAVKKVPASSGR